MINFEEELKKFKPILEISNIEDSITNDDIIDAIDIIKDLLHVVEEGREITTSSRKEENSYANLNVQDEFNNNSFNSNSQVDAHDKYQNNNNDSNSIANNKFNATTETVGNYDEDELSNTIHNFNNNFKNKSNSKTTRNYYNKK
ncbi:MAG: hypothetical protein R3Y29_04490 [bacterium]